jgi:hypothetical protein
MHLNRTGDPWFGSQMVDGSETRASPKHDGWVQCNDTSIPDRSLSLPLLPFWRTSACSPRFCSDQSSPTSQLIQLSVPIVQAPIFGRAQDPTKVSAR